MVPEGTRIESVVAHVAGTVPTVLSSVIWGPVREGSTHHSFNVPVSPPAPSLTDSVQSPDRSSPPNALRAFSGEKLP